MLPGWPRSPRHLIHHMNQVGSACCLLLYKCSANVHCMLSMPSLMQAHLPAAAHLQPPGTVCARAHGLSSYPDRWPRAGTCGGRLVAHWARTRLGLHTRGPHVSHALVHDTRLETALCSFGRCAPAQVHSARHNAPCSLAIPGFTHGCLMRYQGLGCSPPCVPKCILACPTLEKTWGLQPLWRP